MSSSLTIRDFTIKFINRCPIIRSSRLDRTLKALINSFSSSNYLEEIDYLNKLRVIYYLKRLEYKDYELASKYKSKSTTMYINIYTNNNIGLFSTSSFLDLDYTKDLTLASINPSLKDNLDSLNYYLLTYSIMFRDNSKLYNLLRNILY